MVSAQNWVAVSGNGELGIIVTQISQSQQYNYSVVRVTGCMHADYHSWHLNPDVSRSISGTASYTPGDFSFDIAGGEYWDYITHDFTIYHDSEGSKSVSFTVHYGVTGTSTFGDNKSASVSLNLTRIPKVPSPPGQPQFSNITPTSVTVSWSASTDDGGDPVYEYLLRRWTGTSMSGSYVDSSANNRTRNVTGLTPGTNYTFAAYARNHAWGGYSDHSSPNTLLVSGAVWIRVGGVWRRAVPYVRYNGVWKVAVPYVRSGGTWELTD